MEQPQYAPPPAPPAQKSNTGLIIGIIVGVLLLCCCCVLVVVFVLPALMGPDMQNIFEDIERELSMAAPALLPLLA
jgi:hypothetical protein